MKSVIVTIFFLASFKALAVESDSLDVVIDTCNCPKIERFASDIQSVLAEAYSQNHPSEIPVVFDQLTLLMDLQSQLEVDLSCSQVHGDLNNFEKEISNSLENNSISEVFKNSLSYKSNIDLGEFRPNFMKLATDTDRTLFFKGIIGGEEKYVVMRVGRDGKSIVEVLDSPPSLFKNNEPQGDPSLIGVALNDRIPIPKVTTNSISTNPENSLSYNEERNSTTFASKTNTGVGIESSFITEGGNTLQLGGNLNARGRGIGQATTGEERQLESVRLEVGATYVNGLGDVVDKPEDGEVELRSRLAFDLDSNGETINRQSEIGASYRTGEYSFDVDVRDNSYSMNPEAELRFGNLDANFSKASSIGSGLRINSPGLSFSGIPQISSGDSGNSRFVSDSTDNSETTEEAVNIFSVGARGEVGEGASEADFSYFRQNGERMTTLSGQYQFDQGNLNLEGATGTEDTKANFRFKDNLFYGRQLSLNGYINRDSEIDGGTRTRETTASLHLSESESTPNEFSVDHIRTDRTSSDDDLSEQRLSVHKGFTLTQGESVSTRFSRTSDTRQFIDTSIEASENTNPNLQNRGRQEYARTRTHVAAEVEIGLGDNSGSGELRGVVMKEQTVLGNSRGIAGDVAASWDESSNAVEVGVTVAKSNSSRSTSCRIAARSESGNSRVRSISPQFSNGGGRTSFDCGLTFINSDEGNSAEASFSYRTVNNRGDSFFLRADGIFTDGQKDFSLRAGSEINLSRNTSSLSREERKEANDFREELRELAEEGITGRDIINHGN